MEMKDVSEHASEYSEDKFWLKIKRFSKRLGEDVLISAITLYLVAKDRDTPTWAKSTILAALGYFILPIDVVPDVLLGVGYSDDVTVLTGAIATVASSIKESHKDAAIQQVQCLVN
ncbi:TPA: YkvA family protein [Vibrio vulnificus]